MKKYKAFISYRKKFGNDADLIKNTLVNEYHFSKNDIFLDKHNIGPEQFDARIESSIRNSSSLVLIVTPHCFNPKEDDWFINEIKLALNNHVTIIPIFFDGLKDLTTELSDLRLSFSEEEIEQLKKTQGVQYNFDFSEQTFSTLSDFINKCHVKTDNRKQHRKLIFREIGIWTLIAVVLLILSFVLFVGVGFLWGYISSEKSEEKVLQDNTKIVANTAHFKFCGLEAIYNLEEDSIYVNYDYKEEFPEKPYDIFIQSMSIPGAVVLLNNNLNYLKYLNYFKGGGKHRQLVLLGASALVCVGSFCGFSQGSQWGRLLKQRDTVLRLQTKLKNREIWEVVFEGSILKLKYNQIMFANVLNVHIWIYPDSMNCIAMDHGLRDYSVLLKFNEWEIGKNTYAELVPLIEKSHEQKKNVIFQEITDDGNSIIKSIELPTGIVGIRFLQPTEQEDINLTIEEYNKWKRYKEWISQ